MSTVSGMHETCEFGSNGTTVTTGNSTCDAVVGSPTVDTSWHAAGTRSFDCSVTTAAARNVRVVGASATTRYHAVALKVGAAPSANTVILQIENGGTNKAHIRHLTDGTIQYRDGSAPKTWTGAPSMVSGEFWLCLQLVGTTPSVSLYNLNTGALIASKTFAAGDYTGGAFTQARAGVITAAATNYDLKVDELIADSAAEPALPTVPPTVGAGSDVTADVATRVALDGTIANGSGTQTWSRVSGPTVTIASAGSTDTTCINTGGAGVTVMQLADGAVTDTMSITWTALPTVALVQAVVLGTGWTASAGTLLDCLTDGDDATYIQSSNNPSSLDLTVRLHNMVTPSGDIAFRLGIDVTGTGTMDVSLYKHNGSTLVKKVSATALADGTVVIPMVAADIAAMGTDWSHEDGYGAVALCEFTVA